MWKVGAALRELVQQLGLIERALRGTDAARLPGRKSLGLSRKEW